MDLKTKRLVVKAFVDFIAIVVSVAGKDGIRLVDEAFTQWRKVLKPRAKSTKKRKQLKKS